MMTAELSEAERARVADMKRQWLAVFGNDDFIRACYQVGLIQGWRNVQSVERLPKQDNQRHPFHQSNRLPEW